MPEPEPTNPESTDPKPPTDQKTTPPSPEPEPKPPSDDKGAPSLLNQQDAAPGAPEKYEAFTAPEGFEIPEEQHKEISELFKGLGISQENGQKLVDFYAKNMIEAADSPYKVWGETQKGWMDEIKADPEIGHKLPEVRATVSRAIDGLGDPKLAAAFREAMDLTGAGSNPAFIRAFYKLAQKVTEGTHVEGRGPSPHGQAKGGTNQRPPAAKALYPDLPSGA